MVDKTKVSLILACSILVAAVMPPVVTFILAIIIVFCVVVIFSLKLIPLTSRRMDMQPDPSYIPHVAIVIACSNEPASMVRRTLEAVNLLDYENYEVYVIDNNNTNEANWRQIEETCTVLGSKFKFYHVDHIKGYKAGALNYIQRYISSHIEVLAVVDADYIVDSNFLRDTVGYFKNPTIGIVQTPQDYSNKDENRGLYNDYELFFSRYMNIAQSCDAVTFTGTMGMIRQKLFKEPLKWSEKNITEDTEVGISVHSLGYSGVYIDKSFGRGVMPFNYDSLARQRTRWVYGNAQIIKAKLWRVLFVEGFTFRQKIGFVNQLFAWIHFELVLGMLFVANGLSWFIYGNRFQCLTAKIIGIALIFTMLVQLSLFLFFSRRKTPISDKLRGFLTHYGLLPAMTYPWMYCFLGGRLGFQVTKKEKEEQRRSGRRILKAAIIPILLTIGLLFTGWGKLFETHLFFMIGVVVLVEIISVVYTLEEFKEL